MVADLKINVQQNSTHFYAIYFILITKWWFRNYLEVFKKFFFELHGRILLTMKYLVSKHDHYCAVDNEYLMAM